MPTRPPRRHSWAALHLASCCSWIAVERWARHLHRHPAIGLVMTHVKTVFYSNVRRRCHLALGSWSCEESYGVRRVIFSRRTWRNLGKRVLHCLHGRAIELQLVADVLFSLDCVILRDNDVITIMSLAFL